MGYIQIGWCKAWIIEKLKGHTVGALSKYKERGLLVEGKHWKKFNGSLHYHFENFNEWIETDGLN